MVNYGLFMNVYVNVYVNVKQLEYTDKFKLLQVIFFIYDVNKCDRININIDEI